MLAITKKLVDYLNDHTRMRDSGYIGSLTDAVLLCGGREDADALSEVYLEHPFDWKYSPLLSVFKKFGDSSYAEKLYNLLINDGRLIDGADTEVLALLGYLQYEPVKQTLANYAFGHTEGDYYYCKDAILGLLHFDCAEYQSVIKGEIVKCYGKGLFSEFIPALVCKLDDRNEYLEPLYELGSSYASTDCNSGIVLGFSLCGKQGERYFRKLLFDPRWETFGGGTGTDHFVYTGLKNLGICFAELYTQVRAMKEPKNLDYALRVLLAMLRNRIYDKDVDTTETLAEIYLLLFGWKNENESDNIIDLLRPFGDEQRDLAYKLEKLLELKMTQEALLENYKI